VVNTPSHILLKWLKYQDKLYIIGKLIFNKKS
jgi:hypothetical protein